MEDKDSSAMLRSNDSFNISFLLNHQAATILMFIKKWEKKEGKESSPMPHSLTG